jgi:hypothetical protein
MIVSCPRRTIPPPVNAPNSYTASVQKTAPGNLLRMWGEPKTDKIKNGIREITSNQRFAWRSLIIFLGIPIPLLIPLGHDEAKFSFRNESLIHVEYTTAVWMPLFVAFIVKGQMG